MMLARLIHRSQFLFSQGGTTLNIHLYRPHLRNYFDNDPTKVQQELKELSTKYSLNEKNLERLFKLKPEVFIPGSDARSEVEDKIKFLNKLEETEPVAGILNEALFDSHHLLMTMNNNDILEFINKTKEYGYDSKAACQLLANATNIIHNKFDLLYEEKLQIFQQYLHLTKEEVADLFLHEPFLLTCSSDMLRQSVIYFIEKQNEVLTRQRILTLLRDLGEIFLMGRGSLSMLVRWLKNWGIGNRQLWGILLEHPLILLNHPGEIFHFKAKMFRQFKFTTRMGQTLLRKHPAALICSVRALQAKLLVARDRLKIKLDENNLEYLTFKFSANIRPRAEMLIKGKVPYTSEDIVTYLNCTEEEFLKKTGVPREKLLEQKERFSITPELDFPQKKCLQNYPSEEKIFQYAKRYYPKYDLILRKL